MLTTFSNEGHNDCTMIVRSRVEASALHSRPCKSRCGLMEIKQTAFGAQCKLETCAGGIIRLDLNANLGGASPASGGFEIGRTAATGRVMSR
jgi:hypothetical protein